ncbi:MAG: radical SAM family heme chaperone HemW [Pirellulales bacterium]
MSPLEYAQPQTARAAYIHVPFCARRCGYCSFTLVAGRDDLIEPYLEALARELSWLETPRPVETLFLGGGTPTQLKGPALRRLLAHVLKWHPLDREHEFSVEANPEDLSPQTVATLAENGVTRISLGAQSFDEQKLRALERQHSAADIRHAVELVRLHDIDVSLDLIFAAPGESLDDWKSDLEMAIELQPGHISTYGLTFERGTQFWNRLRQGHMYPVAEELDRTMFETAIDRLDAAGFEHYEVSNFARAGKRCRHNEAYWLGEEYFAAGPGAARYLNGVRSMNHRSTTTYIARVLGRRSPLAESERLDDGERALEVLVFALRRREGIDRVWFEKKTGMSLDSLVGEMLQPLVELQLISDDDQRIRLTRDGLLVSDSILSRFLTGIQVATSLGQS